MKTIILAAASMFLLGLSWICLFSPQRIQAYALSHVANVRWFASKEWAKTGQYIVSIRMCGGLALLIGLILAWVVIQKLRVFL